MATFEWLAVLYFVALGVAAPAAAIPWRQRLGAGGLALTSAAGIVAIAHGTGDVLRAWLPHLYLAAGYWIPALLTPAPAGTTRFERWLTGTEDRLRPRLPALPSSVAHLTELAYLACYPLVPAALAVVWTRGTEADVARYWLAVLAAGFACYASLPWLTSRPPRLLDKKGLPPGGVAATNAFVLRRVSHQWNTFPSGHVAVSMAAAGATLPISTPAGVAIGLVAVAVAVGAAAGRYHYVVDVLLGLAVAASAVAASVLASPA